MKSGKWIWLFRSLSDQGARRFRRAPNYIEILLEHYIKRLFERNHVNWIKRFYKELFFIECRCFFWERMVIFFICELCRADLFAGCVAAVDCFKEWADGATGRQQAT